MQNWKITHRYCKAMGLLAATALSLAVAHTSLAQEQNATLVGFEVINGALLEGELRDLVQSDDNYVVARSGFGANLVNLHNMEMVVYGVADLAEVESLSLTIESSINEASGVAIISLLNWITGEYQDVGSYAIGSIEEAITLSDIPATDYVDELGTIEMHIRHLVFVPYLAYTFESSIDLVEMTLTSSVESIPFEFPYDGGDHVLVEGLDRFPHASFRIRSSGENPLPFEIVAQDFDGQDIDNASLLLDPGSGAIIDVDWAWRYVARMPLYDAGDAAGVMANAKNLVNEKWSERECDNKWLTVAVIASSGEHCVTFRAYHEDEDARTDSECPLKAKWEVKQGRNQTHRTSGEVPITEGTSSELCEEIDANDRIARRVLVFSVKCQSDADGVCRISIVK